MGDVDRTGVNDGCRGVWGLAVVLVLGLVGLGGLAGCKRELKRFAFAPTMTIDEVASTDLNAARLFRDLSASSSNMGHEEKLERLELLHPVTRKPFLVIQNRTALIGFAWDWGLSVKVRAAEGVAPDEALSVYRGLMSSTLPCEQVLGDESSGFFSDLERGDPCSSHAGWSAKVHCELPLDGSAVEAILDVFCDSDTDEDVPRTLRYNLDYEVRPGWVLKRYEAKYGSPP